MHDPAISYDLIAEMMQSHYRLPLHYFTTTSTTTVIATPTTTTTTSAILVFGVSDRGWRGLGH